MVDVIRNNGIKQIEDNAIEEQPDQGVKKFDEDEFDGRFHGSANDFDVNKMNHVREEYDKD